MVFDFLFLINRGDFLTSLLKIYSNALVSRCCKSRVLTVEAANAFDKLGCDWLTSLFSQHLCSVVGDKLNGDILDLSSLDDAGLDRQVGSYITLLNFVATYFCKFTPTKKMDDTFIKTLAQAFGAVTKAFNAMDARVKALEEDDKAEDEETKQIMQEFQSLVAKMESSTPPSAESTPTPAPTPVPVPTPSPVPTPVPSSNPLMTEDISPAAAPVPGQEQTTPPATDTMVTSPI